MQDYVGEDHDEMLEREAADLQGEQDRAALLYGWVWCSACAQYTLPPSCRFCGGDTHPSPRIPGADLGRRGEAGDDFSSKTGSGSRSCVSHQSSPVPPRLTRALEARGASEEEDEAA